jgi:hypothetical protein
LAQSGVFVHPLHLPHLPSMSGEEKKKKEERRKKQQAKGSEQKE